MRRNWDRITWITWSPSINGGLLWHGPGLAVASQKDRDIVLCGIATVFGVDTTAREAYQHGYQQVFAEDAMNGLSEEEHRYVCTPIFPRIGRLRSTNEIVAALLATEHASAGDNA